MLKIARWYFYTALLSYPIFSKRSFLTFSNEIVKVEHRSKRHVYFDRISLICLQFHFVRVVLKSVKITFAKNWVDDTFISNCYPTQFLVKDLFPLFHMRLSKFWGSRKIMIFGRSKWPIFAQFWASRLRKLEKIFCYNWMRYQLDIELSACQFLAKDLFALRRTAILKFEAQMSWKFSSKIHN